MAVTDSVSPLTSQLAHQMAQQMASAALEQASAATNGTGSTGASGASSSDTPSNELDGNSFIQLLTAQLQAQDPLDPIDPTTFTTQLVEFNQLQQLIDINQTLTQAATPASSTTAQLKPANQAAI